MPSHTVSKVAAVTLAFWVTLGLGYYISLGVTFTALAIILILQISRRNFHPLLFWLAIIATTTAGTEISDFMDRSLGLGYVAGSAILLTGLVSTLGAWWVRTRNLHVNPLVGKDSELFFWLAVLFSNSLGTAFGDFLVDNLGLSFIEGTLVTAAVIGIVAGLHYARSVNDALLFWIAFVFTRPFGATFGDFLTISQICLNRELACSGLQQMRRKLMDTKVLSGSPMASAILTAW